MTHGLLIDELLFRLKRGEITISMDPLTASEMLNKSYSFLYPIALKHFEWFYTKSVALGGATALFTCPSDYKDFICLAVPTAYKGMARYLTHREIETVQKNGRLAGIASDPVCYENFDETSKLTKVTIAPAVDGTLWYLWRFPEVASTSTTFEVTNFGGANAPIIPFLMEELVMLQAVLFSNQRHALSPDINPDALKQQLDSVQDQFDNLLQSMQADVQLTKEVQGV